jgi:hypothetical protein
MRGLLAYLLSKKDQKGVQRPRVTVVGGTFAGTTAREISREFAVLRALRPNLGVAVVHEALRLPPTAPEPSDEQWLAIAEFWTRKMGFQAWVAVAHGDGHIHIAASRILIDGSVVSDKHDWTLSERVVRELERVFDLDHVKSSHLLDPHNDWVQQKAPTKAQSAVQENSGLPLPSDIVASVIDELLSQPQTVTSFVQGLIAAGIDVRPNIASTGKVSGLAYMLGGVKVTAKAMGNAYTWANLHKRGLDFNDKRDLATLRAALEREQPETSPDRLAAYDEIDGDAALLNSSPVLSAAQAYVSAQVANFVDAAETNSILVFPQHRGPSSVGPSYGIDKLNDPEVLRRVLMGASLTSAVRAEIVDCRIVVVTGLGGEQLKTMDRYGLQPFAVTEISPNVFEASIRLVPANEPEPSIREHRVVAKKVALMTGGEATSLLHLPGFPRQGEVRGGGRSGPVLLRRAIQVVADIGVELVRLARAAIRAADKLRRTVPAASDHDTQSDVLTVQTMELPSDAVNEIEVWPADRPTNRKEEDSSYEDAGPGFG